ncbi:MAG: glycosyltransferase [Crocinitomicaceae bacterium]|nr:glycosyltransferase [Crocinitomicaceae bacterium]
MADSDIHILILSSWYPSKEHPFLGNFVERQARLLAQRYTVTVVHTVAKDGGEMKFLKSDTAEFDEILVKYNGNGHIFARKKQERAALIRGIDRLENVNLIIGNVLLPRGWQFLVTRKNFGCPVFYIEHGSYFRPNGPFKWGRIHHWILGQIRKKATEIIAVSDVLKADMEPNFKKRKINVIGNHIDVNLFSAKPKSKNEKTQFLHISTFDHNTKNPDGIIEAVEILKKENSNFKLTIICDEDITDWKNYCEELGLNDVLEFIGPLPWHELVPYYHSSDAFLLFSDYETFSIVLAEAWATGTPVISSSVGISSNMNSELGIQVEKGNSEDLKNAMLEFIIGNPQFDQNTLTKKAAEYSEESILNEWSKLISKHVG